MAERKEQPADPRDLQKLYAAFEAVDNVVLKKYITKLSQAPCIPISNELKALRIGDNVEMYRVGSIVYDKNENIQDKLTTVYSGVFSLRNCGIMMLINAKKDHADLYIGVVTRELIARDRFAFGRCRRLQPEWKGTKECILREFCRCKTYPGKKRNR